MNYHIKTLKKELKNVNRKNRTIEYGNELMNYYVKKIRGIWDCKDFNQVKLSLQLFIDEYGYLPIAIQIMLFELITHYFKIFTLFLIDFNVPRINK
jgi:hypothetical protein